MGSATNGTVYICLIDSPEDPDDPNKPAGLKQGVFAPIVEFKIQDFGEPIFLPLVGFLPFPFLATLPPFLF